MSLRGYVKKTRPALWLSAFPEQKVRTYVKDYGENKPGLKHIKPKMRAVSKRNDQEYRRYKREAAKFVSDARGFDDPCPVVFAVAELKRQIPQHWTGPCRILPERLQVSQVHHKRGRAGSLLRDRRFWLAVSSTGHDWIHRHPARARRLGLLCAVGEWNTPPKSVDADGATGQ